MGQASRVCLVGGAIVAALFGCVAGPVVAGAETAASSARSMGQIKGSVTYCNEAGASSFEPVVTLHHRDGKIAATRVWHGVDVPGEPTNGSVHFVFSEPAGYYYLTQGNDYPIPPQARQIHLHARQTFTAHIDDCAGPAAAVTQEAQEARQVRQAFVKALATMAAQRAAAERAAALEPKCTQAEVRIKTSPGVPHMGGFSELISVENSGRTTCSLGLYPLLAFHSALSPSIYTAGPSSSTPNEPSNVPVVLAHEETASAIFSGADMPTGTQTSCPTFSSFTANIAEGTPATFHTSVANCSGIEVSAFVAGFTGMYPPTGRVHGRVPTCSGSGSIPGPIVRLNFLTKGKAPYSNFAFPSSKVSEPFTFDLSPGRYRVESAHGPSRAVTIHTGRVSQLGLFGVCSKAIIPHPGVQNPPTTTTTTEAAPAAQLSTPVQSGFDQDEAFCAQLPLHGTIHYEVNGGAATMTVQVSGLPHKSLVAINWANNTVRGYEVGSVRTNDDGEAM
jgi:uncharacterized protein DUF4232